ncbi:hypothetical protein MMC21_001015 [Puttea exsequens]|nr:hypothetical protein [Puttea exsequens]
MSSPESGPGPNEKVVEQYKSYGIGGRGNLRKPSELVIVKDTVDDNGEKRRRSSVIDTVTGIFRRSSTTAAPTEEE